MKSVSAGLSVGIEWRQASALSRDYELASGDDVFGRLVFQKVFGSLAEAASEAGRWTFKRGGFLKPHVTARVAATDADIAVYEPNFTSSHGRLRLAGGEVLELASSNFWSTEWTLKDAVGAALVRFHNKGFVHNGASVDVEPAVLGRADLVFLIALVWYILLLHKQDSAALLAST